MNTTPDRPEPIIADIEVVPYKRRMGPQEAVDALIDGYSVLVVDFYSSGLEVLRFLKQNVNQKYVDQSFSGQREARAAYRDLSNRLLLRVNSHKLVVRKAPAIGWLKILYPDLNEFLLPFPQVQGLNSSWQWYEKGIFIPVLKQKIHPWFGTYFPTRFEHLELFDHWLKNYRGGKETAFDIGIGSGVLSLMMLKYGFGKIYGTDTNPNAIIGLNEYSKGNKLSGKLSLLHGDLFAESNIPTELIVFNPPWLPTSDGSDGLDTAIYYSEDLLPRFFTEAYRRLKTGGRVVLLFSNLANITEVAITHPIETELLSGGKFVKELLVQKKVRPASNKIKRNQHWRSNEMVELWVLKKYN
jgi:SAM-dependent methyltransferase